MDQPFTMFLAYLIPFGGLAIVIFAIAAILEGKTHMSKGSIVRSLYFYLMSIVTLAIVAGSLIFLVNLGLKSWVFTKADQLSSRLGPPPVLYLDSTTPSEATKAAAPAAPGATVLTCKDACQLTDAQKSNIDSWKASYASWQEASAHPESQRTRDAVAALSFLIVALPFFIIHFRIVQKDAKQSVDEEHGVIRPTYFYFISLASLLMVVIAGGFLINIALKTWVFPSAQQADKLASNIYPVQQVSSERDSVKSISACGEKCGIDKETVALANSWITDYDAWQKEVSTPQNSTQRQAASSIPFVLVGIPLFWYHWSIVRKQSKDKKDLNTPSKTTS